MQDFEGETRRAAANREAASRAALRAQLAGLPQPENEYEVTIPDLPEADDQAEGAVEDAADLAARRRREAALLEQAELKKRSQVRHILAAALLCCGTVLEPSGICHLSSHLRLQKPILLYIRLVRWLQVDALRTSCFFLSDSI